MTWTIDPPNSAVRTIAVFSNTASFALHVVVRESKVKRMVVRMHQLGGITIIIYKGRCTG